LRFRYERKKGGREKKATTKLLPNPTYFPPIHVKQYDTKACYAGMKKRRKINNKISLVIPIISKALISVWAIKIKLIVYMN